MDDIAPLISRADEERHRWVREAFMQCLRSDAAVCSSLVDAVTLHTSIRKPSVLPSLSSLVAALGITTEKLLTEDITARIGPSLQEAMTTAIKDFESALQCLLPRGTELRTLRTVVDAFIRDKLKLPPWGWLPLELHALFVREYISLLRVSTSRKR